MNWWSSWRELAIVIAPNANAMMWLDEHPRTGAWSWRLVAIGEH